ncbi:50S ribosomal protein L6 [Leptospira interrogans]|nr:50S ribosomal protein L6 [Leptospira interrogans]
MSRIGKAEIKLPDKVEVKQENANIKVKGPLGELFTPIFEGISVKTENGIVKLERSNEDQKSRSSSRIDKSSSDELCQRCKSRLGKKS